jgi:CheY-like chemotaxis protein
MKPDQGKEPPAPILRVKERVPCQDVGPTSIARTNVKPGILVADNEESTRTLLVSALANRGFAVWVAANGPRALELYRQFAPHIAVVVLDVNIPVTDGPHTLEELRKINPEVCCIFLTRGDNGKYLMGDLTLLGSEIVFQKPLQADTTADMLWNMVPIEA